MNKLQSSMQKTSIVLMMAGALLVAGAQTAPEKRDRVSALSQRIAGGKAKLEYADKWGYLQSVLANLDIDVDSQILVFSKTSFQQQRISPEKPGRFTSTTTRLSVRFRMRR